MYHGGAYFKGGLKGFCTENPVDDSRQDEKAFSTPPCKPAPSPKQSPQTINVDLEDNSPLPSPPILASPKVASIMYPVHLLPKPPWERLK